MSNFHEQAAHLKAVFDKLKRQLKVQQEQIDSLKRMKCDPDQAINEFCDLITPVFGQLIDMRLGIDAGDTQKVCKLARHMGYHLELSGDELHDLNTACWLHNIGLIGLKDDVITTPYSKLTPEQRKELDSSPLKGEAVLISIPQFENVAKIIRHQYERYDGKGYPDLLFAQRIPICSRIMAIAVDFYELQNGIFLGEQLDYDEAYEYILKGAFKNYDPNVVEAFKKALEEIPREATVNSRELTLKSDMVEAGMTLTQPLIVDNNMVLLGAGHMLTNELIDRVLKLETKLGRRFVFHVEREGYEELEAALNGLDEDAYEAVADVLEGLID